MSGIYNDYVLSKNKILHEIKPNTGRKTMCGKKIESAFLYGDIRTVRQRHRNCQKCISSKSK